MLNGREVAGLDRMLPLNTETWPKVRFEVGCRCRVFTAKLAAWDGARGSQQWKR